MKYKSFRILFNELPNKLKIIKRPPKSLYAVGNIQLLYEDSFAIIGSRKVSDYGVKNCEYFAREFALRRITTVSGMALGTDTVAHQETIKNNGKTIAVLGCGFNHIFPKENEVLFEKIICSGGLVISEYSENTKWNKNYFPQRNRIISAISEGVLVIEAAYRSGTTITARNAKEQGKKVFAVPGIIGCIGGVGVNNLIKNGAILSTEIQDILKFYPQFMNKKRITTQPKSSIKKEYERIYQLLQEKPRDMEELVNLLETTVNNALQTITNMELEKMICQDPCGKYYLLERR